MPNLKLNPRVGLSEHLSELEQALPQKCLQPKFRGGPLRQAALRSIELELGTVATKSSEPLARVPRQECGKTNFSTVTVVITTKVFESTDRLEVEEKTRFGAQQEERAHARHVSLQIP